MYGFLWSTSKYNGRKKQSLARICSTVCRDVGKCYVYCLSCPQLLVVFAHKKQMTFYIRRIFFAFFFLTHSCNVLRVFWLCCKNISCSFRFNYVTSMHVIIKGELNYNHSLSPCVCSLLNDNWLPLACSLFHSLLSFSISFFKGPCINRSPYRTHCLFRPNLISVVGVLLVIWRLDSRCYTHHMFNDVGPTSDYATKDYLNQWILVFIVRKYVISDSLNKWIQHAVEMACFISWHQTNDWETSE